ncbi:MAG: ArsR family transcriptional regulator [Candidatus Woesearchaeota archaeon]|nr:ArsR family transcriptional regulator [Candidatus Woesearchaeota archaeon]
MGTVRITITRVSYEEDNQDVNRELQVIGLALGLFSQRDRDRSKFRIFIELLRDTRRQGPGLSTDDLAQTLHLSRATVIHHLRTLIDAGFAKETAGRYTLAVSSLEELLHNIQEDLTKTLQDLKTVAQHIDHELGIGQ